MLYQTPPISSAENTARVMAKNLQENATISNESCDTCSESVSDDWASESSPDRLSAPETPTKDPIICDDSKYTPFPSLPSSVDGPVLDQVTRCALAWDQCYLQWQIGSTPSNLVHAAWALVATQMTCSDKVSFGITNGETSRSSTRSLRVDCAAGQGIPEYLQAVRARAASHQALMKSLKDRRKNGPKPSTLFSVQISGNLQNHEDTFSECESDATDSSDLHNVEKHALIIQLRFQGVRLQAEALFDGNFIEPWLIPRLLKRLASYIQQLRLLGADLSKNLANIDMMSLDDREQVWQWSGTLPAAAECCIHDMFQDQALAEPCAPAVDAWDVQLTYGELDQLTGRLAGHLIGLGITAGVMVLYASKSSCGCQGPC
ncbi:MAG: hypothetical protein Q9208_006498 [Pyrenodesmia sp. 3 TL-2023]